MSWKSWVPFSVAIISLSPVREFVDGVNDGPRALLIPI
jgi:hypothetical protein